MRIGILLYPNCSVWNASAPMEMLDRANKAQYYYTETGQNKKFDISYISTIGTNALLPFPSTNSNIETIDNHRPLDTIIVPGFNVSPDLVLDEIKDLISWLIEQHSKNVTIVSFCSGSIILAEAGILRNRTATTHWLLKDFFESRYPEIPLDLSKVVIDYGNIIIGGSATSYQNLILMLIERYMGKTIAIAVSKVYLLNMNKDRPDSFMNLAYEKVHNDEKIRLAQSFIKSNYDRIISLEEIADKIHLNKRTFIRRFKKALNDTPLNYTNRLKVERAKHILETQTKTFEEIAFSMGYENASAFRKIFQKHTGVSPISYRSRFSLNKEFYTGF